MKSSQKPPFFLVFGAIPFSIIIQGCQPSIQNQGKPMAPNEERAEQREQLNKETVEQSLTGQQANAIRSAKEYLSISGFSRDGLIEQLSSEVGSRYPVEDATFAVDSLNADWNKEAVRSAKEYLKIMAFSCEGLIEQLSSSAGNKYTASQATYGAQQAGACN